MSIRSLGVFAALLVACSSSTVEQPDPQQQDDPCEHLANEQGLAAVDFAVTNQRADRVVIASPCCNTDQPVLAVAVAAGATAPTYSPSPCGCTCELFMEEDSACGCSTERQSYRMLAPGNTLTLDWAGTFFEEVPLPPECAAPGNSGPCSVERAAQAGALSFELTVLTDVDLPPEPACETEVCIAWPGTLGGNELVVTTAMDFSAAGAQTVAMTID